MAGNLALERQALAKFHGLREKRRVASGLQQAAHPM